MVSIVVPVYNEENLIVQFHEAVSSVLQGIVEAWEVVYVNDGSTDSTLELLKSLQALDPHVVVVELSRNWGQVGAIFAGLRTARGRAVSSWMPIFRIPRRLCRNSLMRGETAPRLW
jgi:polyisoprenyl-phosphate glycosyltransferase